MLIQRWNQLLFAHWPLRFETVRAVVPRELELERFEGRAWVGVIPFHMTNVRVAWTPPVPGLSAFPELNVRTYVRYRGTPGVYFFSLDAANPLAVVAARTLFHLPYYHARMQAKVSSAEVRYDSVRTSRDAPSAVLRARYRATGSVYTAVPESLDHFLVERYSLFTVWRGQVWRVDVRHPPWPLQPAEAELETNTMAAAAGIDLPPVEPLLHYADRQDVDASGPKVLS